MENVYNKFCRIMRKNFVRLLESLVRKDRKEIVDHVFRKRIAAVWAAFLVLAAAGLGLSFGIMAKAESSDIPYDDSYFDDAVFVGDSISVKLKQYVARCHNKGDPVLGDAQFLAVGGLGSFNVQLPITPNSLHPEYEGEKMYLEDSVAATGAKKMYIMFGMNDIVPYGIDGAIRNLEQLIDKILEKSPGLLVAVQNVTPILTEKEQRNLNNAYISEYNEALQEFCARRGFPYLDIASQLKDENGGLVRRYCGDAEGLGMHLSNEGCIPWIAYLRSHPLSDAREEESVPAMAEVSSEAETEDLQEEAFEEIDREEILFIDGESVEDEDSEEDLEDSEEVQEDSEREQEKSEMTEEAPIPVEESAGISDGEQENNSDIPEEAGSSIVKKMDSVELYKQFAMDVSDAPDKVKKPWKPPLKGRLLNEEDS